MEKMEWHKKYKQTLIAAGNVEEKFAEDCLQAGMGSFDYDDSPELCAVAEMGWWDN